MLYMHFINIFETLPDGIKKTANERNKRPGYSRKFNMADRNGRSFCSLVCESFALSFVSSLVYAVFYPWKDVSFLHFD